MSSILVLVEWILDLFGSFLNFLNLGLFQFNRRIFCYILFVLTSCCIKENHHCWIPAVEKTKWLLIIILNHHYFFEILVKSPSAPPGAAPPGSRPPRPPRPDVKTTWTQREQHRVYQSCTTRVHFSYVSSSFHIFSHERFNSSFCDSSRDDAAFQNFRSDCVYTRRHLLCISAYDVKFTPWYFWQRCMQSSPTTPA